MLAAYGPANNKAPLNRFPIWKYVMIAILLVIVTIYALPVFFGESPAIQVAIKGGKKVTPALVATIKNTLNKNKISYLTLKSKPYNVEARFVNTIDQMKALDAIESTLDKKKYVASLNLAPNTPAWLLALGAYPMKMGLDLRGGMYFLLDVDMQTVVHNNLQNYAEELRNDLRHRNIRYAGIILRHDRGIELQFRDNIALNRAKDYTASHYPALKLTLDKARPHSLFAIINPIELQHIKQYAVQQVIQVMRNRVNELGVAEASVTQQGADRVVIELPGIQDAARAKEILGGTATLKVMMVNEKADVQNALKGKVPIGSTLFYTSHGQPYVLKNRVIITGKSIVGASSGFDQQSSLPCVNVKLSGPEVSNFSHVTRENVGHLMAIVLVKTSFTRQKINGKWKNITSVNQKIVSVATIESQLGNTFQITGLSSPMESQTLALQIRAGALPAPVQIVSEQQIGPTLGAHNIKMGMISVTVAMILVILFMAFYYRLFGLIADFALVLNLFFIVAIMSIMPGATLSLPGIAGIVLNVGMAIDANVLIFERIREELRNKVSPQAAIHAGYKHAFTAIVDSNVTTLIVAVILFAIGTGAVQGFAVTLIIGILTSMFTAITVTRAIVNLIYGSKRNLKSLCIGIKNPV